MISISKYVTLEIEIILKMKHNHDLIIITYNLSVNTKLLSLYVWTRQAFLPWENLFVRISNLYMCSQNHQS